MNLTDEEKRVIDAMGDDDTLSFKELSKKAQIKQEELTHILDSLMERDLLKEKRVSRTIRVENDKQIAIIEVYDKNDNK